MFTVTRLSFVSVMVTALLLGGALAALLWPSADDLTLMQFRGGYLGNAEEMLKKQSKASITASTEKTSLRVQMLEKHGYVRTAADQLETYLRTHPNDITARQEYWRYLKESWQFEKYLAELERHYEPSMPEVYLYEAVMLFERLQAFERMTAFLQRLRQQAPLPTKLYHRLLLLELENGRTAATDALVAAPPPADTWSSDLLLLLSDYYLQRGDTATMLKHAEAYIGSRPKKQAQPIRRELAYMALQQKEYDAARALTSGGLPASQLPDETLVMLVTMAEQKHVRCAAKQDCPAPPTEEIRELLQRQKDGDLDKKAAATLTGWTTSDVYHHVFAEPALFAALDARQQTIYLLHLANLPLDKAAALFRALGMPQLAALAASGQASRSSVSTFPQRAALASLLLRRNREQDAEELLRKAPMPDTSIATFREPGIALAALYAQAGLLKQAQQLASGIEDAPQAMQAWLALLQDYQQQQSPTNLRFEELTFETLTLPLAQQLLTAARRRSDAKPAAALYQRVRSLPVAESREGRQLLVTAAIDAGKAGEVRTLAETLYRQQPVMHTAAAYAQTLLASEEHAPLIELAQAWLPRARGDKEAAFWRQGYWEALRHSGEKDRLRQEWRAYADALTDPRQVLEQAWYIDAAGFADEAARLLMKDDIAPAYPPTDKAVEFLASLPLEEDAAASREAWLAEKVRAAPMEDKAAWLKTLQAIRAWDALVASGKEAAQHSAPAALLVAEGLYQQRDKNALETLLQYWSEQPLDARQCMAFARYADWNKLTQLHTVFNKKLLQQKPDDRQAREVLAENAAMQQDYTAVLTWLEPFAKEDTLALGSRSLYAAALKETGREKEAIRHYTLLADTLYAMPKPLNGYQLSMLADAQRGAGRTRDAAATYRQMLENVPDNMDARTALMHLLLDMGKTKEAMALKR